ncbi:hypothetical protein [uncultured Friedmanniella sp.]|uniref:hypothetical protein n=1 Tax=uncultured Friedmanniella sp. TaxID=335381 RepID=UPI0035CBD866
MTQPPETDLKRPAVLEPRPAAPPSAPQPAPPREPSRRRAWLLAAAVALLVLVYLTVWSTYAAVHTGERYRQLAPGTSGTRDGADFRVLSLVRTDRLADRSGQDPQIVDAGAVFVVAELEMVQRQPTTFINCSDAYLLGPGGRRWESIITDVQRQVPFCDSDDVVIGHPYRYETVYLVPLRDADAVAGVALVDVSTPARTPVLRAPA